MLLNFNNINLFIDQCIFVPNVLSFLFKITINFIEKKWYYLTSLV